MAMAWPWFSIFFEKSVRQPGKPPHGHAQGEVLPLNNMAGGNQIPVGGADHPPFRAHLSQVCSLFCLLTY